MTGQVDVTVQSSPERQVIVTFTGGQTVTVGAAVAANIVTASTERVDVQQLGIVGPQGPAGPPGGAPEVHPVTAISTFSVTHQFSYPPEVRLVDSAGDAVDVGVEYPTPQSVYIEFPTPFTGVIYLS